MYKRIFLLVALLVSSFPYAGNAQNTSDYCYSDCMMYMHNEIECKKECGL